MLIAVSDQSVANTLLEAAQADDIAVVEPQTPGEALKTIAETTPSLIVLERQAGAPDPFDLCGKIRSFGAAEDTPVIIVAEVEDLQAGAAVGVTDWLIKPFSVAYARTDASLAAARCPALATGAVLPMKSSGLPPCTTCKPSIRRRNSASIGLRGLRQRCWEFRSPSSAWWTRIASGSSRRTEARPHAITAGDVILCARRGGT